jgi:CRISPR-associated protein Cas5h
MQTVNYLMTKSPSGFDGSAGGTQIPIEWIFPEIDHSKLRYRVYVTHTDGDWLERLNTLLTTDSWIYPPYLGMSECLAQIEHVTTTSDWTLEQPENAKLLTTVVPVQALDSAPELIQGSQIIKERIPLALNRERKLEAICDVLYERTDKGITTRLNRPAFHVSYKSQGNLTHEIGAFLE